MRILHTSDWHIGRTFHGHGTIEALGGVLEALAETVRARGVDVVLVAGDVFDSATPSATAFAVFERAVAGFRAAGAEVIMTSGNHDSPARLGHLARFAAFGGVHVRCAVDLLDTPVVLSDEHGEVDFYGIPFLEPVLVRHRFPEAEVRTHEQALAVAMDRVRASIARRGNRSVVLAHCFAAGVQAGDVERDISAGGVDLVSASVFDGPDYVALGHIHGRSTITPSVRYSGSPLHYSFGERAAERGAWLVQLDASGLAEVEWVGVPVPRALVQLEGELETLLADPQLAHAEAAWVSARLTDAQRQQDAMPRLQTRFPFAVQLEHRPPRAIVAVDRSYAERIAGRTDAALVADFLALVRGAGPDAEESGWIRDALGTVEAEALA